MPSSLSQIQYFILCLIERHFSGSSIWGESKYAVIVENVLESCSLMVSHWPTYWSPAVSYFKYLSFTPKMYHPHWMHMYTLGGYTVHPDATMVDTPFQKNVFQYHFLNTNSQKFIFILLHYIMKYFGVSLLFSRSLEECCTIFKTSGKVNK